MKRLAWLALLPILAGCAGYTPRPLPAMVPLAQDLRTLDPGGVDVDAPLDLAAVTGLVLRRDPELRAARAQHGVAQAQLLQAGLLANPQLSGNFLPIVAGGVSTGSSTTPAWNAGLSYDLKSLVTLAARRRSAHETAAQVDAQLLWQEWQAVGRARLLAVDLIEGARLRAALLAALDLIAGREARTEAAVRQGNATLATLGPDLAARENAQTAIDDLARAALSRRHELAAMLGLAPETTLRLADRIDLPPLDPASVLALLPTLADRRPDLVSLRLGYAAQDDKYRAAILGQFPNLSFGFTGGSDNSNVRTIGPQITLDLPIFDHNQGMIATERATREQLHDEYAARLQAATGEVRAMLAEIAAQSAQYRRAAGDLPVLARLAGQAQAAFTAQNLDERGYVDLVAAWRSAQQLVLGLEQSMAEQQVAIATLTGAGLPPLQTPVVVQ